MAKSAMEVEKPVRQGRRIQGWKTPVLKENSKTDCDDKNNASIKVVDDFFIPSA